MSTTGQFSTKNPTIKRILREAAELSTSPSSDYHAAPLEDNLFEWHFTLRGAPDSPFAGGIYHGRIVLPPAYPLRPPSFRFLTPSGRFEVNREICLSISGHHEETWQPAWGIRTALVAIRSFMDTDAGGQLGGMNAAANVRKKLADESKSWRCAGGCGNKSCEEIMKEQDQAVAEAENDEEALRARELELAETAREIGMAAPAAPAAPAAAAASSSDTKIPESGLADAQTAVDTAPPTTTTSSPPANPAPANPAPAPAPAQAPLPRFAPVQQQQLLQADNQERDAWIDKAIIGVILGLVFMVGRKILRDSFF